MDCMSGVGAERGYRSRDVGLRNHGRKDQLRHRGNSRQVFTPEQLTTISSCTEIKAHETKTVYSDIVFNVMSKYRLACQMLLISPCNSSICTIDDQTDHRQ